MAGCQSAADEDESKSKSTGSIGLALQVAPGVTVTDASYRITGPTSAPHISAGFSHTCAVEIEGPQARAEEGG